MICTRAVLIPVRGIMALKMRKFFHKTAASFLKRYYILVNDGFSVGKAYSARFLFDWRHSIDKKVALEMFEDDQIVYLGNIMDIIRPGMFIDIGAHTALYSIVAMKRIPELVTHAFEPDRTNLCQLYANLFLNKMQHDINVHEYGLSNTTGTSMFETSNAESSRATRRISTKGNVQITVKRLDDVLSDTEQTAVIKIDVEGHECEVVDGALHFLEKNHCLLQIESSENNLGRLTGQLEKLGYRHIKSLYDHYFSNIPELLDNQ